MRILFLTHRLPYADNRGDRIRARHLLQFLAGHAEIDLISLVHSPEEAERSEDLRPWAHVTVARVPPVRKYGRAVSALFTHGTLTHAMLDSPGIDAAVASHVRERRPDVVLAYCSGMARFILEPPLRDIPSVVDLVDVDSDKWRLLAQATPGPRRWIYEREARLLAEFEAVAARHARATLVVNERERDLLARAIPDARIDVVPVGVDADLLRPPGPPAPGRRVCFCGVMNYGPNEQAVTWFAQQVWPSVHRAHPDARFVIIGSDPTPAVRRLADADASIEVTGAVPDVRPLLWGASVSVAPLFISRGVQNKVLEAVAAGLPCVVTPAVRDGLPPEILPACREAGDAAEFTRHVIGLLALSPVERRAIAEQANLGALTWEQRLQPVLGILQEALGDGRS